MSSPSSRPEIPTIKPRQKFEGHTDYVDTVIHLPDGQRMMTCSMDGSLRVWDLKTGKQIGEDWRDGNSGVCTIALSPHGKKVVSGSLDGGVRIWDMDTGTVITKWMGHTAKVWSVCWSRDGHRVVGGSEDGTVREWNVENGEIILGPIDTGHIHVNAVVYSPDMTMFATAGYHVPWTESPVKVWDTKTGELVAILNGHRSGWVWCLAWTPDGKTLISGSFDQSIRIWNTTTWKQLALLECTNLVHAIAISPNGRILASASFDHTARLWNLDNNQLIGGPPLQHTHPVTYVSFSPDGKSLATGSDHNAYTWDVTAILKQADLDYLLEQRDVADATQSPVRQPIKVSPRVPRRFFDDTPRLSPRRLQPLSPSRETTLRDHFLSLFRPTHPDARDTPPQPRPFHWVRNRLSGRLNGVDIDPHERPSAIVDVPYAKGKRRNASAREKRRPTSRRPPKVNTAQQSSGVGHAQSTSQTQPQAAIPTLSTTSEPINSRTNPHAMIKHAGGWTRFWLFVCCASPEYIDGRH